MTSRDDDRIGRRVWAAARVSGLAAMLGAGAYLAACGSTAPVANGPAAASADPFSASPTAGTTDEGRARAMGPTLPQNASVLDSVEQTQRGTLKSGGTIRVVSARGDLTGQRELRWVAGGVEPYRNAKCTQRFQLGNNPKPARKANLLLCWRTSAEKSVITILVDPDGKPSKAKAVRELDKKWRAMG
jgi:hypothetical protein